MLNVLLPVAGRSSRFPNMRPKWMLTHPRGNMMIVEALKGLDLAEVDNIYIIALQEHADAYNVEHALNTQLASLGILDKVQFVFLKEPTRHQPETVAKAIEQAKIKGGIYIKDSDNYFVDTPVVGNQIACYDLHHLEKVNARCKSYIEVDKNGFLTNIVEKKIVSSLFCSGGYSFASASEYMNHYNKLAGNGDLYISHIVYSMILDDQRFVCSNVKDYIDWGTLKEWRDYTRQYTTLFVDLDGTLVYNSGQYSDPRWGETDGIQANIDAVNTLYKSGKVEVIITTSRTEAFREVTVEQLSKVGAHYHQIIFGLPHGNRIIINDYARTNPYKSCSAINLKRDSCDLQDMLEDSIGYMLDVPNSSQNVAPMDLRGRSASPSEVGMSLN